MHSPNFCWVFFLLIRTMKEYVLRYIHLRSESFGSIIYDIDVLVCLTRQITSLLEDLKRKEEWRRNSDEEILGKLNSANSENEKIYLENEKLKVSLF